jgi:hypothetical protein
VVADWAAGVWRHRYARLPHLRHLFLPWYYKHIQRIASFFDGTRFSVHRVFSLLFLFYLLFIYVLLLSLFCLPNSRATAADD